MAATNQTTNLHLNQWAADDPVKREDFNADNAKIDAALHALSTQTNIVTGSYVGNGTQNRKITLEKTPTAVLVLYYGARLNYNSSNCYGGLAVTNHPAYNTDSSQNKYAAVTITSGGFLVSTCNSPQYVFTNNQNDVYHYIAVL